MGADRSKFINKIKNKSGYMLQQTANANETIE